jgi:hypothetical protein
MSVADVTEGAELCVSKKIASRFFQVAGLSIQVNSDLLFQENTFAPRFDSFEINRPLEENIVLSHHFDTAASPQSVQVPGDIHYFRPPWAIYARPEQWIYQRIKPAPPHAPYYQTTVTDTHHTRLDIYNGDDLRQKFLTGGLTSLTLFPTDQILLGRLLAYRSGCIMHSLGLILNGKGCLFAGHSDAGKTTLAGMMKKQGAEILCDDRNIIRKTKDASREYMLSGTWSHGDMPDVSAETAPLAGIFFLTQSHRDHLTPIQDETVCFERLLACLIRPLETRDWWEHSLDFLTRLSRHVPCWNLEFTKNGNPCDMIGVRLT